MKWASVCLLLMALGWLADAQNYHKPAPAEPQWPSWKPAAPQPAPQAPQQTPRYTPPAQHPAPQAPQQTPRYTPPAQHPAPQAPQQTPRYTPPAQHPAPQAPQQTPRYTPPAQHPAPQQTPRYTPPAQHPAPQAPQQTPRYTPPRQLPAPKAPELPQRPAVRPHKDAGQSQYPAKNPNTSPPLEPFQSCEVDTASRVRCGAHGITVDGCESINCCFDGQTCYYGKAVTVQCTKDGQFIVVVAKDATLPNIDLESVSLLGPGAGCSPVGTTSSFLIYQFPVTDCGTTVTEEPGVLIYENRMSSSYEVAMGPLGYITRDSTYELLFQCRYIGTSVEALVIEVGLTPPQPPLAALGPIRATLQLGNGECTIKGCDEDVAAYSSFYQEMDYPVQKVLRQRVYVDVQVLERTDPNLFLTLGRCWTTTSPDPDTVPQWDLLIDGCPYRDDRYQTRLLVVSGVEQPTHHRRFVFKMFTFVDQSTHTPLREKVFLHCSTALCMPSGGENCEPRCYRKRRDAGKATQRATPNTEVVTSMEIQFVSPS